MVTKPTGGRPGRPPLALRDDPERYAIAYFAARLSRPLHLYAGTPTALAKIIMQSYHGIVETAEKRAEVAEALLAGHDVRLETRKHRGGNKVDKQWRNLDWSNARADNWCKKVRKLEKRLSNVIPSDAEDATIDQKDAQWLAMMMGAWRLAIGVYSYRGDPFAGAEWFAAQAGESDYFRRVIAPQFVAFSVLRAPEEERDFLLARIKSE